jgi:hypothetical protein
MQSSVKSYSHRDDDGTDARAPELFYLVSSKEHQSRLEKCSGANLRHDVTHPAAAAARESDAEGNKDRRNS